MKSLTKHELDSIIEVAGRHSTRDRLMLKVTFNHGLRASEAVNLDASNIVGNYLVLQRLKASRKTSQPMFDDEKAELLELAKLPGKFFPMCRETFWRKMQAYGKEANIPEVKCHPHCLKHSCGRLAYLGGMKVAEIQTYLGHVNGGNTMVYLEATEEEAALAFATAVGKGGGKE
jgi:type 1 fimbriae regulatory protein FimB